LADLFPAKLTGTVALSQWLKLDYFSQHDLQACNITVGELVGELA
jgi:hypothetical protein